MSSITNAEMFAALREFWPDDAAEAQEFLAALRECADMSMDNPGAGDDFWFRMAAVYEVLTSVISFRDGQPALLPAPRPESARDRLLVAAAERQGLTIASAAAVLGVSRWQARKALDALRAEGALRVRRQGRASRWVLTEGSAA